MRTAPLSATWLWEYIPWFGAKSDADAQRFRAEHQHNMQHETSSLAAQRNSQEQMTLDTPCRNAEVWQISGMWMAVTSCVTLRWSSLRLAVLDAANAQIGAERNRQKTEVTDCVPDLDNADREWRVATAVHGNTTLGVAVGPRRCVADQRRAEADITRAMHERVRLCHVPRPSWLSFVKVWESAG